MHIRFISSQVHAFLQYLLEILDRGNADDLRVTHLIAKSQSSFVI